MTSFLSFKGGSPVFHSHRYEWKRSLSEARSSLPWKSIRFPIMTTKPYVSHLMWVLIWLAISTRDCMSVRIEGKDILMSCCACPNTSSHSTCRCARPQNLETNLRHELPVDNANTGNSMCPTTLENLLWIFINIHLFLHYWMCYLNISIKYYGENAHIVMVG